MFWERRVFRPCHRPLGVTCAAPVNTLSTLLNGFQTSLRRPLYHSSQQCKRLHLSLLRAWHKHLGKVKCVELIRRLKTLPWPPGPVVGWVTGTSWECFGLSFWCRSDLLSARHFARRAPQWGAVLTLFQPPHPATRRGSCASSVSSAPKRVTTAGVASVAARASGFVRSR